MGEPYSIAVIELAGIYKGYEVLDHILKSASIEHVLSRTICPGKYFIIVKGQTGDVENCVLQAREKGAQAIVDIAVIPRVDERIFAALSGTGDLQKKFPETLAVIETFSVVSAINAADAAIKEAQVELIRIHPGMATGGRGLVYLTGAVDDLKSGVDAAVDRIGGEGMLAGYSILTNPHPDLIKEIL
jgi:microcompartment protein CcmL/EutN